MTDHDSGYKRLFSHPEMILLWIYRNGSTINNSSCYFLLSFGDVEGAIMNISLNPHLEEWVKCKVDSGFYNSASEVMREALRLLEERDQLRELRLQELKREIQKGIDSGDATPLDMEAIKARGRQRLAAQQRQG